RRPGHPAPVRSGLGLPRSPPERLRRWCGGQRPYPRLRRRPAAAGLGRPEPVVPLLAATRPILEHGPGALPVRAYPPRYGGLSDLGWRRSLWFVVVRPAQVSETGLALGHHPFDKALALATII